MQPYLKQPRDLVIPNRYSKHHIRKLAPRAQEVGTRPPSYCLLRR